MRTMRIILALILGLTFLQTDDRAMPSSMSSTEIATQCLCLNGCIAPCDNMGADGDGCLLSATCGLVCANVLAADFFDGLAAPSVSKRLPFAVDDITRPQGASSPFRPPPARPLADDSFAKRKPGACAKSISAMSAQWLERIDDHQVNRRLK